MTLGLVLLLLSGCTAVGNYARFEYDPQTRQLVLAKCSQRAWSLFRGSASGEVYSEACQPASVNGALRNETSAEEIAKQAARAAVLAVVGGGLPDLSGLADGGGFFSDGDDAGEAD